MRQIFDGFPSPGRMEKLSHLMITGLCFLKHKDVDLRRPVGLYKTSLKFYETEPSCPCMYRQPVQL